MYIKPYTLGTHPLQKENHLHWTFIFHPLLVYVTVFINQQYVTSLKASLLHFHYRFFSLRVLARLQFYGESHKSTALDARKHKFTLRNNEDYNLQLVFPKSTWMIIRQPKTLFARFLPRNDPFPLFIALIDFFISNYIFISSFRRISISAVDAFSQPLKRVVFMLMPNWNINASQIARCPVLYLLFNGIWDGFLHNSLHLRGTDNKINTKSNQPFLNIVNRHNSLLLKEKCHLLFHRHPTDLHYPFIATLFSIQHFY